MELVRTIDWLDHHIVAIDQTRLPHEVVVLDIFSVEELAHAIERLAIRGAPALGVAGALGAAMAARDEPDRRDRDLANLRASRPTAVNLGWGIDHAMASLPDGAEAVLKTALDLIETDANRNRALSERGADFLSEHVEGPMAIQTHCNAGALACVEWGTALGVVRSLHERRRVRHVYVDETRPLLQGARLTTWELRAMGVDHTLVVDSAGPTVLATGRADAVVVGADRITANGDVVNKVGTYPLALAAARRGVPFLVAAPESTIDPATEHGSAVEIEVRDGAEILGPLPEMTTLNLAFDVTPADLVTAIVTEDRIIRPALGERPA